MAYVKSVHFEGSCGSLMAIWIHRFLPNIGWQCDMSMTFLETTKKGRTLWNLTPGTQQRGPEHPLFSAWDLTQKNHGIPSGELSHSNGKIHHAINGKIHYKWPFSIAMLVHQRVLSVAKYKRLVHIDMLLKKICQLLVALFDCIISSVPCSC